MRRIAKTVLVCLGASLALADASSQPTPASGSRNPSVWDLKLGSHARELSTTDFIDFACGTNGGPPSLALGSWVDYTRCRAEPDSGNREVYFRYDDEAEYWARAQNLDMQIQLYQYTAAFGIPVIASALFDGDGFYVGFRLVSDPRVDVAVRELGVTLGGYMIARYGQEGWTCADLPRQEGETEYRGAFIKRRCAKATADGIALKLVVETRSFRRPGQAAIDPRDNTPTQGQFESSTRFQAVMAGAVKNRDERLAAIEALGPAVKDPLLARARNCPGCDLRGADLKRANLAGANLAGANLSGANLHAATLTGANLSGADLTKANINRANLRQANLQRSDLKQAMLFGSSLDGADLSGADLSNALAGKVELPRANLSGAKLIATDLRNARLNDANFAGANLTNSWMHNAQVARANLSGATLIYVVAWQASLTGANLSHADARGADFFRARLREADLTSADFSYTRLESADLWAAKLTGTNLSDAELPAGFVPPQSGQ